MGKRNKKKRTRPASAVSVSKTKNEIKNNTKQNNNTNQEENYEQNHNDYEDKQKYMEAKTMMMGLPPLLLERHIIQVTEKKDRKQITKSLDGILGHTHTLGHTEDILVEVALLDTFYYKIKARFRNEETMQMLKYLRKRIRRSEVLQIKPKFEFYLNKFNQPQKGTFEVCSRELTTEMMKECILTIEDIQEVMRNMRTTGNKIACSSIRFLPLLAIFAALARLHALFSTLVSSLVSVYENLATLREYLPFADRDSEETEVILPPELASQIDNDIGHDTSAGKLREMLSVMNDQYNSHTRIRYANLKPPPINSSSSTSDSLSTQSHSTSSFSSAPPPTSSKNKAFERNVNLNNILRNQQYQESIGEGKQVTETGLKLWQTGQNSVNAISGIDLGDMNLSNKSKNKKRKRKEQSTNEQQDRPKKEKTYKEKIIIIII